MELANHVVVGEQTLQLMSEMETFNQWMFDSIQPYIGQRILEAGAGIGNFTGRLVDRQRVVALEIEADRVQRLRARFAAYPNVIPEVGDLADPSLLRLAHHTFDTVICLNVLEHIERHVDALTYMHGVLAPGGRLILLVPAHPGLYSSLDRELGHYRRYRESDLHTLLERVGYRVERRFYINLAGIVGWWFNGRILQRDLLPRTQLGWYERLAPVFRWAEEALGRRWGLSVVFVASKP